MTDTKIKMPSGNQPLTVGALRLTLEGVPDDAEVYAEDYDERHP